MKAEEEKKEIDQDESDVEDSTQPSTVTFGRPSKNSLPNEVRKGEVGHIRDMQRVQEEGADSVLTIQYLFAKNVKFIYIPNVLKLFINNKYYKYYEYINSYK